MQKDPSKKCLEFILKGRETEKEESFKLYGRSIGLGRIISHLLDFRQTFLSFYNEEPYLHTISNFEELNVPESQYAAELFTDSNLINKKKKYIVNESIPKVNLNTFSNVVENFLKKHPARIKLSIEILKEVGERYSQDEWRDSIPLNGAIDILFNKYQKYLD